MMFDKILKSRLQKKLDAFQAGACRNFLPTAERILNFCFGVGKCCGADVFIAKMASFMIKFLGL